EVIIKFLKRISVLLQSPVIIIRTDNDTEFKNQVLKEYFDTVGKHSRTKHIVVCYHFIKEHMEKEWNAVYDAHNEVAYLMLKSMTPELQRQFKNSSPYEMLQELKSMFEKQARVESVGLILNGLTSDFARFVRNYNMHNIGKTIGELHIMLIEYEKGKGKGKGKGKDKSYVPEPKNPKPNAKDHPAKNDACHHCKEVGHWKRNCPVYLAELMKNKKQVGHASSSGIFTIELFSFPNKSWVYGTHICITKQGLREARKPKQGGLYLYVGNGVRAQVEAIKSYDLVLPNGLVICLDNCHYAPSITRSVVSVSRLVENGFVQCFTDYGLSVSRNDVLYFNDIPSNGIYEIDMSNSVPNVNTIYNVSNKRVKHNLDSTYLWQCRLAHISKKRIRKLQYDRLLKSMDDESFDQYVSCLSGKMTRKSFLHRSKRATDLFGLIHSDVCGPLRHASRQGASYFITFTDDYSLYVYIYLLKHKHEVFETFKVFKNEVENQLEMTIKALRSDRGGEYISQEFKDYLKACGIVQQLTPPYTPQHNGVPERRNRTLLDMVRSMMNLTTLPLSFWDYALEATPRILNMVPTKKRDTPNRLEQRSVKYIFIGYPKETMGYYFYFSPKNKIVVARYAEFFEKKLLSQEVSGRAGDLEEIQDEDTSPSEITSEISIEIEEVEEHSFGDLNEPTNYKVAMLDLNSNKWLDAMIVKMQSMKENQVWRLVDLPPNGKTVGSKWLFKKKTDMDVNVHTYKARLVAKGFTQTYKVDYEETSSPIADIRAIRILIAKAVFYDYEICQMDVKTTFLNGYLDENIYMVQPGGFIDPKHPKKVCKLQRSIYGLKKASRSWNKRFDEEIKKFRFTQNFDEPCVYQKASGSNVTFLILYVDDIIVMGNHIPSLQSVKEYLERLDLNKTQGASTPGEVKRMQNVPYASAIGSIMYAVRCTIPDVVFAKNITSRFQQNPCELHWTAVKTILNYLRNTKVAKIDRRYLGGQAPINRPPRPSFTTLKNTKDMFLVYGGNPQAELRVDCYCDAGFETDRDDTKSQTGYVFILNGGAVDWKSSKQITTAMSATEAEYIAASKAGMVAV
nr:hypothetical protein [Tanacetum cinerariifolium]